MTRENSKRSVLQRDCRSSAGTSAAAKIDEQLNELNNQAERCRRLAGATHDREVSAMLGSMAEGYEQTARQLSKKRSS